MKLSDFDVVHKKSGEYVMSSRGRGTSGGGVVDTVPDGGACKKFYKPVNLMSSQEDVLSKLKKNSRLDLSIVKERARRKSSLHALYKGDYAGSILSYAPEIIRCIEEEGHKYIAIVISIDGGSCILEVRMIS